jgi:hypothetical protein
MEVELLAIGCHWLVFVLVLSDLTWGSAHAGISRGQHPLLVASALW